MRKLLLLPVLLLTIGVAAQSSYGFYGLHNMNMNFRQGWGFGMNGLSSPMLKKSPVKFQMGLGYSLIGMGQRNFRDVVLADGETPRDVSFSNMRYTINSIFRISVPGPNGRFIPYTEVMPGIHFSNSTISITDHEADNSSSTMAGKAFGFNLGVAAGLMVQLNDYIAIDAGMVWDKSQNPGNMIMMNSVSVADGISYSMKQAPSTNMTFRFGIRVSLGNDGCCPVSGCQIKSHHTTCGAEHLPHR